MKVSKKLLNKITLKLKPYMSELVNIAENCCEENGEGEWYNGIFENKDTIIIQECYDDGTTYNTEYYIYSISKDSLREASNDEDDILREFDSESHWLDCVGVFFITGTSPINKTNKAKREYGDECVIDALPYNILEIEDQSEFDELVELSKNLVESIETNMTSLWNDDLENTTECVILNDCEIDEIWDDKRKTKEYTGINDDLKKVKTLLRRLSK